MIVTKVMEQIRQDLAYAWRLFRRSRGFYAGAVLTLALGIGANGAVFTVLRAVLLQPLPYSDPDRLVMVWRPRVADQAESRDLLRPVFQRPVPVRVAGVPHPSGRR